MENLQQQFRKILIEQEGSEGLIVESLWAEPIHLDVYLIKNIPFYAFLYSTEDLVKTEDISSEHYVRELITPSGNSTLRLSGDLADLKEMRKLLQEKACDSELSTSAQLLAINIPKSVSYAHIMEIVVQKCEVSDMDYEEACISEYHRNTI